jgi:hypothetical protein
LDKGGRTLADQKQDKTEQSSETERIPAMQLLLDNTFLLLFIGVTMPTVLFLIWGIMEVASVPIAN